MAEKLGEWRGVKPAAGPSGVAITTRSRTSDADEMVLDAVADHLGRLRRADLAVVCRRQPLAPGLDEAGRRQCRRGRLNHRKAALTAESSARRANAIIGANDEQYRLARDAQCRHIVGLRAAIATITKRLAQPTGDTFTAKDGKACTQRAKGYATQAERFEKLRRVQHLRAELPRAEADRDGKRVHVTDGGKRLAKTRYHLDAAGLSWAQWRANWDCARYRIVANGSGDEPLGNLIITVSPGGQVSLRLPKPLGHLANAQRGRDVLSGPAAFAYRADEWAARIVGGQSVSYTISRRPGRAGRYLTASWATPPQTVGVAPGACDAGVFAEGPVVGVDLNEGHLALRRLDEHGNPVGTPARIDVDLSGTSARPDAQVRHAITRLIRYPRRHKVGTIAVEDLDFADARTLGREAMGRGRRGKRFRKSAAGIPTAVFRRRLTAQTGRHGIRLLAVNPAYSSAWGEQHGRKPYENVTRHLGVPPACGGAAAPVIGRRAQGYKARRREGVTCTRPEDRTGRATDQAAPESQRVTSSHHQPGMRGTKSRPARLDKYVAIGPGNRYPATANNGHPHQ
ncbi:MAG TPA: hypothetical protein VLZ05_14215 [Mycobacterium sp.]|nr:hypothetical protein [Mycobacterium sp.]HUH69908.1 hypothetical protein [Mycobacterium sp.]